MKSNHVSYLALLFVTLSVCVYSQPVPKIPLDTTYTVASTYRKLIKQYPDIKVATASSSSSVREVRNVVYRTVEDSPFGKRELHADMFIPPDEKSPVVIMIHGGGWRSGDKSLNVAMAKHLAANGFVVMSVEYRLSLEARYPAAVHDVKAAIRWLREHADTYAADPQRIAVAGYSAGGQLASLIGVTNGDNHFEDDSGSVNFSSSVQAVIDLDGLLDFTHPESLALKRTEFSADVSWLGGFYKAIPERWKEASPIVWVDRDAPPFLFINSSQTRFHAGCADMVKRLDQHAIYNEVHRLEDAPHSFWFFHPWFDPTMDYMVNFLNKVFNSSRR